MPRFDRDTREPIAAPLRALLLALAFCLAAAAPAAAAAPNWLDPADLSQPGRDASNPVVEMDGAGNTVSIWERQSTIDPSFNLQISTRSAGGVFTAPADFSLKSTDPQLAMSSSGEAVAVWKHFENPPGVYTIKMANRPPGGSFSAPVTVYTAPPGVIPQEPRVAVGAGGTIAVTWSRVDPDSGLDKVVCGIDPMTTLPFNCPNPSFVEASVRPAGGAFTTAERISTERGTAPGGETPTEKEEREKAESVLSAGGARPIVDPAGNVTVVWSAFNGTDAVVQTAARPAGGDFSDPVQVSQSAEDAGQAAIGADAGGNVIASWLRNDGPATIVQAAIKAPGAAFAPLGDVSPPGGTAERPVLGVAPDGTATIAWRLSGVNVFLQASTRAPGGAFSAPQNISSGNENPLFHELSVGDEGDAIVAWSGANGGEEITRAAVRTAGSSSFGAPVAVSQPSPNFFHPRTSMDAGGDATVVWVRDNGSHGIVQWAGYDADPPQLRDVSIPSTATVAEPVPFSASASDVWPVGAPSFEFGDGGQAQGTSVSHAYAAPGVYSITVTATDAVGRTTATSGSLPVKARNHFTIGKLTRNRKKGTATLRVTIPEPGTLVATGKGMKKSTMRAADGGTLKLPIKSAGKSLKRLKAKGKLKLKLKIAYSPIGGDTSTQQHKVTLQKKLR